MNNLEKLAQAGVVKAEALSQQEKQVIESLSAEEVNALVSIKSKLQQTGFLDAAPKLI